MNCIEDAIELANQTVNTNILADKIKLAINTILSELKCQNDKISALSDDIIKHQNILCETLKPMVGQKIYWAHPDWNYETHTICNVRCDIVKSDFWHKKYQNKRCVIIDVDDGDGYYIADLIGKSLFFDEQEAIRHSRQPDLKRKDS